MSIAELYEWAMEHGVEDVEVMILDDGGSPWSMELEEIEISADGEHVYIG